MKSLLNRCLSESDVDSRFIFLLHGLATTLGLTVMIIGFVFSKDKSFYPEMLLAVSGAGGFASLGRYVTKKAGLPTNTPVQTDPPAQADSPAAGSTPSASQQ